MKGDVVSQQAWAPVSLHNVCALHFPLPAVIKTPMQVTHRSYEVVQKHVTVSMRQIPPHALIAATVGRVLLLLGEKVWSFRFIYFFKFGR